MPIGFTMAEFWSKGELYRPADKLACAVIIYLALAKAGIGITMLNRIKFVKDVFQRA